MFQNICWRSSDPLVGQVRKMRGKRRGEDEVGYGCLYWLQRKLGVLDDPSCSIQGRQMSTTTTNRCHSSRINNRRAVPLVKQAAGVCRGHLSHAYQIPASTGEKMTISRHCCVGLSCARSLISHAVNVDVTSEDAIAVIHVKIPCNYRYITFVLQQPTDDVTMYVGFAAASAAAGNNFR